MKKLQKKSARPNSYEIALNVNLATKLKVKKMANDNGLAIDDQLSFIFGKGVSDPYCGKKISLKSHLLALKVSATR